MIEATPKPKPPVDEPIPVQAAPSLPEALKAGLTHEDGYDGAVQSFANIANLAAESWALHKTPGKLSTVVGAARILNGVRQEASSFGSKEAWADVRSIFAERFFDVCDSITEKTADGTTLASRKIHEAGDRLRGLKGRDFPRLLGSWGVLASSAEIVDKMAAAANYDGGRVE